MRVNLSEAGRNAVYLEEEVKEVNLSLLFTSNLGKISHKVN
jgi:hypothetical protein